MPIIIDGHNLLHTTHKSEEGSQTLSDVQLCRIVGRYLKLIRENGEIIFDGTGPRDKSGFDGISNLEVFFAGQDTADTVIEHKIKASTAPKRLTIVSSDRRLRRAAQTRKAAAVKSEDFWIDVQKQLRKRRTVREPAEKHLGLTEGETEKWLDFFGIKE
jgi:predicted RNA-binding protein with PIN domain